MVAIRVQLRRLQRAELYDSLSTMLNSGLPLLETLQTLIDSSAETPSRGAGGKGDAGGGGMLVALWKDIPLGN